MAVYARGTSQETVFPVSAPSQSQQERLNGLIAEADRLQPGTYSTLSQASFAVMDMGQLPQSIINNEGGGQSAFSLTDESGNDLVLMSEEYVSEDLIDTNTGLAVDLGALGGAILLFHEGQHLEYGDANNGLDACQHAGLQHQQAQATIEAANDEGYAGLPVDSLCEAVQDALEGAFLNEVACAQGGGTPSNPDGTPFVETEFPEECGA